MTAGGSDQKTWGTEGQPECWTSSQQPWWPELGDGGGGGGGCGGGCGGGGGGCCSGCLGVGGET